MTSFISLLLTLVMVFSGAAYSEDPAAASSRVVTIEDIVLTVDGTEYALNPSISMGFASEGETALFDFSIPCGERNLFPVQAQADESGVTLLLGSASNAYTFTPDFFAEILEDSFDAEMIASLTEYYEALPMQRYPAGGTAPSDEQLAEIEAFFSALDATVSEATYTIDGAEYSGTRGQVSLSHEDVCEFVDVVLGGEEALAPLADYLNALSSMTGEAPIEFTSFSELMAASGAELSADFDLTSGETTGVGTMLFHLTSEDFSMDIPVEFTVYSETKVAFYVPIQPDAGSEALSLYALVDGNNIDLSIDMPTTEENETFGMSMNQTVADDGSVEAVFHYVINMAGTSVTLYISEVFAPDMTGSAAFDMSIADESMSMALRMNMVVADAPVENRVAAAEKIVIASSDDYSDNTGLLLALMGMLGDAENLMADDSVAAIADLFTALEESYYEDVYYDYSDSEPYWSDGDDDPADLSFAVPDFSALEGFTLTEQYIYADNSDCAYFYFDSTSESDSYSSLNIDLIGMQTSFSNYVLAEDGSIVPCEDTIISVEERDDAVFISTLIPGASLNLYYFGSELTSADLLEYLSTLL